MINDIQVLTQFQTFIDELNATNSNLDKQTVLINWLVNKESPDIEKLLNYVFSYKYKFYVTSSNLLKNIEMKADNCSDKTIYDVLNSLCTRQVTGHDAIKLVNGYISCRPTFSELILRIIDKKINCRIDAKTINKVKHFIPTFDVALGEKFDEKRFNWQDEVWFASRKLDGIRCVSMINDDSCYSRQGEEFSSLSVLKSSLQTIPELQGFVLDGELALTTDDGSDDFQGIMKEIRRKDHTIQQIRLNIFDMLTEEEFNTKTSTRTFSERYSVLESLKEKLESTGHIKVVEQFKIDSVGGFDILKEKALENKWEGLMLRKDDIYKGKRSFDLLKYKEFSDAEYIVDSINVGTKPMLLNGVMQEVECLASVNITHKGNIVQVGSGFNDQQRIMYKNNPSEIIGKTIKVKFFEETQDQNGNFSLRFPILLQIYENGRFD